VNGEAIFATRPYLRYHEGKDLRFTRTKDKRFTYIISLKWPGEVLQSKLVRAEAGSSIRLLGVDQDLKWHQDQSGLTIELPKGLQDQAGRPGRQVYAFKVESQPWEQISAALPGN